MTAPLVRLERPAPSVRLLVLDRADHLNAMNADLCSAVRAGLAEASADRSTRCVVLTGAGRAFSVGLDLTGMGAAPDADGVDPARDLFSMQEHLSRMVAAIRATPQPVIAAVNGPAAGIGLALALGSDIRYAARSAVFRAVFLNAGVSNCDMGTSWLLPRLIGASRAHELMLTGRRVSAEEALTIGLVADVVDDGRVVDRALEAAEQIGEWSPWAIRLTKAGMWTALEIPSQQAAIAFEDRQQIMGAHGRAPAESVRAFLEKRPARHTD